MTGDAHGATTLEGALEPVVICGVVRIVNGKAWVCTSAPHQHPTPRHAPHSDRHTFQRRYPNTTH